MISREVHPRHVAARRALITQLVPGGPAEKWRKSGTTPNWTPNTSTSSERRVASPARSTPRHGGHYDGRAE